LKPNVLIVLTVAEQQHYDRSSDWIAGVDRFAVCPIGEGALIRFLLRMGESVDTAVAILSRVRAHRRCEFWPDSVSYLDADLSTVSGHRQVTDSYLVNLARGRRGLLATLDEPLAERHPDHCLLLSPGALAARPGTVGRSCGTLKRKRTWRTPCAQGRCGWCPRGEDRLPRWPDVG